MSHQQQVTPYEDGGNNRDDEYLNDILKDLNLADDSEATVTIGLMMLYRLYNRVRELEEYRDRSQRREDQHQQLQQQLEQWRHEQDIESEQRRHRQRQDNEKQFEFETKHEQEMFRKELQTLQQRHLNDEIQSQKRWEIEKKLLESQLEQLLTDSRQSKTEHDEELAKTKDEHFKRRQQAEDEWQLQKQTMEEQWQRQSNLQQQQWQYLEMETKHEIENLKENIIKDNKVHQSEMQRLKQALDSATERHRKEREQWCKRNEEQKQRQKTYIFENDKL